MDFTPPLPTTLNGDIYPELLVLAEKVSIESAKLVSTYNPHLLHAIKELLRKVNSYYSNKIESEGTHPIDIERAMREEFDSDEDKRNLQQLSLVYIEVQQQIETWVEKQECNPFSKQFILDVHYQLYSNPSMHPFLKIKKIEESDNQITMKAGELRKQNVAINRHIAPDYLALDSFLNQYESYYRLSPHFTQAKKLVYAMASHHRLTWLHPFLDGNGRTSRLILDGILNHIGLEGYGLWNISRGLSRNDSEYRRYLAHADMVRQGDRDGRGALSSNGLKEYVTFMLECSLDQIEFMNRHLRLDLLSSRMEKFIRLSQEGFFDQEPLPKYAEKLLKELLLKGEIARGEVKNVIGTKDRTASTLIKKLLELEYIESTTTKSPIRLKLNSFFASYLFPELMPTSK